MHKKLIMWCVVAALGIMPLAEDLLGAETADDRSVEIKKLLLSPAAEPVPAMAYGLLPRQFDKKRGNAALLYTSAAELSPDEDPEELREKISKWEDMTIDELPRKEVEKIMASYSNSFHYVELAAHRTECHWEMPLEDGYSMQIPHLANFRGIVRAMRLKIRLNIADGQTDQAIRMLQNGMQMGRNIAEGPTLIQGLVGVAISALSLREAENLIQMPGSPNLYWALTALPDPMIDMYPALEYERESLFYEFPRLRTIEDDVLTPPQASAIVSDFMKKMAGLSGGPKQVPFQGLLPVGWVMAHYADAKQFLAARGFSQKRIETMPAAQAVLIYQKQEYREMQDNLFKWFALPYHKSRPRLEEAERELGKLHRDKLKANIFSILAPALFRIAFIQARLDRHIAILRTVEAIRMYAADHSGQLPASLAEITSVPIPSDPVTGGPFIYNRTDARNARLEAPKSPAESRRRPVYELTIRR